MKKALAFVAAATMVFSMFTACSSNRKITKQQITMQQPTTPKLPTQKKTILPAKAKPLNWAAWAH